jgi:hypothetical protein
MPLNSDQKLLKTGMGVRNTYIYPVRAGSGKLTTRHYTIAYHIILKIEIKK